MVQHISLIKKHANLNMWGKNLRIFKVLSVNSIVYRLWLFADKSTTEGEKTFAIIIGLLTGVALLIIFLTFIRKVSEGPGN